MNIEDTNSKFDFEDDLSTKESLRKIRIEFIKRGIRNVILIALIFVMYMVYLMLCQSNMFVSEISQISPLNECTLDWTLGWAFFSTSIFLSVYLVRLIFIKFTPSLMRYVEKEIGKIGFKFKKRFESGALFLILNSVALAILVYVDLGVIVFDNSVDSFYLQSLIVLYMGICLVVPIFWCFYYDKFIIKLRNNYYIYLDFHYRIRSKKDSESDIIGIHFTSNRLCSRFDQSGRLIHEKISAVRWLPRSGKKRIGIDPYLHFHEFSVPVNFQKQFLNIALALSDWEKCYAVKKRTMTSENPDQKKKDLDQSTNRLFHKFQT